MKRSLHYLLLFSLLLGTKQYSFAQTAAKAYWSLSVNANPELTGALASGAQTMDASLVVNNYAIYASTAATLGDLVGIADTAQRVKPSGTVGWPANQTTDVATQWVEFSVQPTAGNKLTVSRIKIDFGDAGSTSTMKANLYYSLDDFATAPTQINTDAPNLVLPKYATGNIWKIVDYSALNIVVPSNKTLRFRIYPFWTGTASSTSKYLVMKDVVIQGTTTLETLPLNFTSFNAKLNPSAKQVKLDWTTVNEKNTFSFTVERGDGKQFSVIGTVGAANAAGKQTYSFVDNSPLNGMNYYRLKQIDVDGTSVLSKVVKVDNGEIVKFSVSPNPASGAEVVAVHPLASAKAMIKIFTSQGKLVSTIRPSLGTTSTTIDIAKLVAGNYLVVFFNGGKPSTAKLIRN